MQCDTQSLDEKGREQASYNYVDLKTLEFRDCGEFQGKAELVSVDNYTSDISSHLSRCHLGCEAISGGALILACLGLFSMPKMQKRDVYLCQAPCTSWSILVEAKRMQVPWPQGS